MDKYKITKIIGDGTFGVVSKAVCISTGEVVAIKMMKKKFGSWEECIQLREVKSLKKLIHPNIVRLKEVIRVNDVLHLVFEYIDDNLYNYSKNRSTPFNDKEIQTIIYQTLQGLSYMHKHGFFHRDMKPENLLIEPTNLTIKLCDFGQAREIRSMPPYTDYISTRWYRAPECILKSTIYNSPIDIFGIGCIMAELYLMKPLFPGSSENDQLFKICSLLGSPLKDQWPDGYKLASKLGYNFPNFSPTPLNSIITSASKEAIDLMYSMIKFDPQKRITASQALNHPFFQSHVPTPITSKESNATRKRTPEFSAVINKNQEENKINSNDNQFRLNEEQKSYLKNSEIKSINPIINIESENQAKETSTFNLNSSFESGSSNSSKQMKTLKDNLKNCRSQRKIPGWMQEIKVSSELLGSGIKNMSKINNIEEDFLNLSSNKIILNQDKLISQNNQITDAKPSLHKLIENNLPLGRLVKNHNESTKSKNIVNTSLEKDNYQSNIKDKSKIISSPYFEKNENDPDPYLFAQPSLSSESNFEYHKKHNISQNIFAKNQINQGHMPRPYIQSKFALENRILNPYLEQVSKPSMGIKSFFSEEPIATGSYNIMENNDKLNKKETDILDDFVKNHSLQSNPSSFNTNNEYSSFNYGRFNYK